MTMTTIMAVNLYVSYPFNFPIPIALNKVNPRFFITIKQLHGDV